MPGENVLRGAAAFAKMLPAMSRAISGSVAWTPVHAVVARDGALGCTTGVLHLPAADSAQSSTGRYASCWRRGADGAWRMVAHSRVMAEADRAFARFSADSGGPAGAFARWVATDGMLLGGRAVPARGPEQVGKAFAGFPADGKFAWGPIDALAAASRDGDLGFTIGEARIAATPGDVSYSKYLTIWRREPDGRYRFIFDIGSERPAPPGR